MVLAAAVLASCVASPQVVEPACAPGGASLAIPIGAATMTPLCERAYAEPGMTDDEQRTLKAAYRTARADLARALGAPHGESPVVLFCRTASCKVSFGADPGSAAASDLGFVRDGFFADTGFMARPTVIVTAPNEGTTRILTHELVHAEMKSYASYDSVPTWFNEGMATYIAHEPRCDEYPPWSTFEVRRLDTKTAWQAHLRESGAIRATYCQARNEVQAWVETLGDSKRLAPALRAVLARVARGEAFQLAGVTP